MPSMLRLPSGLFHSLFPTNTPQAFLFSCGYHMPCPVQPPLFDHPSITWRVIMNLHPPVSSPFGLTFSSLHPFVMYDPPVYVPPTPP